MNLLKQAVKVIKLEQEGLDMIDRGWNRNRRTQFKPVLFTAGKSDHLSLAVSQ